MTLLLGFSVIECSQTLRWDHAVLHRTYRTLAVDPRLLRRPAEPVAPCILYLPAAAAHPTKACFTVQARILVLVCCCLCAAC